MKIEVQPILDLKLNGATSTLLILDNDVHILLDCGLNLQMDFSAYNNFLPKLRKVDIILLSHVGAEYVGALPFLLNNKTFGSQAKSIKIYSTTPVMKLGLFNSYNQYLNTMLLSNDEELAQSHTEQTFRKFYTAYDKCKQIQFFQKKVVRIKQKDIIISPICIGNSLGACAWIIQDNLINIMYMIQFNHNRDLHLDGINIARFIKKRIDILITEQNLISTDINVQTAQSAAIAAAANHPTSNSTISSTRLTNNRTISDLKETLKTAIQNAITTYSSLIIVSNPSERVIEIIMILWQIFNEAKEKAKGKDEPFPPIDFFHNYKKFMQDLVNDQIKYMRQETADILVDFNPLAPENNFINFENVLSPQPTIPIIGGTPAGMPAPPSAHRGPRIIVTTIDCLYLPQMLNFIQNFAKSDKNTLLFVGKQNSKNLFKRNQWIRQGFKGIIKEEPLILSELTKSIFKQFHAANTNLKDSDASDQQQHSLLSQQPELNQQSSNVEIEGGNPTNVDGASSNKMVVEDISDNVTVATVNDVAIEDIDGRGLDMDKDVFNNEIIQEREQLFDYKQKDYYKFFFSVTKYKKSDYGEELTEEEMESLKKISRKKRNEQAVRTYKTPEQIAQQVYKLLEDPRHQSFNFLFHSFMEIQEFNILSVSDERSASNLFTLLKPKYRFFMNWINQGIAKEEIFQVDTQIHNQSLDIFNFKSQIQMNSKMQGHRFIGKITMSISYNPGSEPKANLSLEQELNNSNPNRQYYGDYPLEKLLEYLQKSGYTFTVGLGGINYQDKVIIKKSGQNFNLEGIRCQEFYEIRKLVYDFLHDFQQTS